MSNLLSYMCISILSALAILIALLRDIPISPRSIIESVLFGTPDTDSSDLIDILSSFRLAAIICANELSSVIFIVFFEILSRCVQHLHRG